MNIKRPCFFLSSTIHKLPLLYNLFSPEYRILLMNKFPLFADFFQGKALGFLHRLIDLSIEEDGEDLTSRAVFSPSSSSEATIMVRQNCIIAGLPFIVQILDRIPGNTSTTFMASEGSFVSSENIVAVIRGETVKILKAERIILNLLSRVSGIATLTQKFRSKLEGSGVRLLDTRKTSPGMRYPEKYAVLAGGGENHRLNLESLLMLKDNHIDQCGSISRAVNALKRTYSPCPPIEVECRSLLDVEEAVASRVQRIMLDNMSIPEMKKALKLIPGKIESEISGRVDLDNVEMLASLKPTYISSGAVTHSAKPIDLSMKFEVR